MSRLLEEKVVVLTGASLGIGAAIARHCAREGARLVLIARNLEPLKEITRETGGEAWPMDVGDYAAIGRLAQHLGERYGRVDGLVNCAGIYGPIGRTEDVSPTEFEEAIRINLLGTFAMCQALLPLVRKSVRGKVVNYSGGGAATPFPHYSAYATSKAAVVRLTENMALEYPELDVNVVAPGFVLTRLHQQTLAAGEKAGAGFLKSTQEQLEKGGVPPEKAAELTVFLLSRASDRISGKFLSAPWDAWREAAFQSRLREDKDFATLRRIDERNFESVAALKR